MTKERKTITASMSDRARYRILRKLRLRLAKADVQKVESAVPEAFDRLSTGRKDARPVLCCLAEKFGVFKSYFNDDVAIEFDFSHNNLDESTRKQERCFDNFALMLTCFDDVIKNAILIEVHTDRYKDPNFDCMCVLASAFLHNDSIVPVKLEIKKLRHPKQNTLYIAVSRSPFEIKKATVVGLFNTAVAVSTDPRVAYDISIRRFFKNVNTLDKDFIKYIPDGFLSMAQRVIKRKAIEKNAEYVEAKLKRRRKGRAG